MNDDSFVAALKAAKTQDEIWRRSPNPEPRERVGNG